MVKVESCRCHERGWSGCNTYKNGVSVFYLMANRNQRGVAFGFKSLTRDGDHLQAGP